ncbi:MAG: long-chain fatty acid--CoA ligase, partial [Smithella sp.]|nr:long-chain fatty acid--CoA ligase [Smithella sp.]
LENAVSTHNAIQEAAAIGVPDSKWGERPMLLVVLKPEFRNDGITSEVLKSHMKSCAEQGAIPRYAIPDQYIIADDIPKTSVGKVDKKRLRALYTGAI